MPTFTSLTKVLGLANKCIKFLLLMRLSWLERQIGEEFDSGLSLKIDRLHALLNNQDNEYKTYQVIFWLARAWELVKKAVTPPGDGSSLEDLNGWKNENKTNKRRIYCSR